MSRSAGPRIGRCSLDQTGSHWIALDVTYGGPQMNLIQHARVEASLPEVTYEVVFSIEICRIEPVGVSEFFAQESSLSGVATRWMWLVIKQ